jgi:hypothetical protein
MGINITGFFKQAVRNGRLLPVLMFAFFYALLITICCIFIFPLLFPAAVNSNEQGIHHVYNMMTISEISLLPFVIGTFYSYLLVKRFGTEKKIGGETGLSGRKLTVSMTISGMLAFMLVFPFILITDPVTSEGWLRSIYASLLIASLTPLIFLLGLRMNKGKISRLGMITISLVLTFSLPAGLLLRHPWNYFAFISPFYWAGWAWVVSSPLEGLVYGIISAAITFAAIILLYKSVLKTKI